MIQCVDHFIFYYEETLVKASIDLSKCMLSYNDLFYKKVQLCLACTSLQELHRKQLKRVSVCLSLSMLPLLYLSYRRGQKLNTFSKLQSVLQKSIFKSQYLSLRIIVILTWSVQQRRLEINQCTLHLSVSMEKSLMIIVPVYYNLYYCYHICSMGKLKREVKDTKPHSISLRRHGYSQCLLFTIHVLLTLIFPMDMEKIYLV